MKKQQLQKMVKSIFGDDDLRARFAKDPEGVLTEFALTPAEQKAVLSPRMKLALVTGKGMLADGVLDSWF